MSDFRKRRLQARFVDIARAALADAGGDRDMAGQTLFDLARESEEGFALAEMARLSLRVLDPPSGVNARLILENAIRERRTRVQALQQPT